MSVDMDMNPSEPYCVFNDPGTSPLRDTPDPCYSLAWSIVAAVTFIGPVSSSSTHVEEQWAPMFPQSSTVSSGTADPRILRRVYAPRVLPPTAEQLASVQTLFGLSKTQLAQVCRVQRQTVYDWYAGNFEAEGDNARRLARLYDIAGKLRAAGHRPLSRRLVTRSLESGSTVLELLASSDTTVDGIRTIFAQLEAATDAKRSRGVAAVRSRLGWAETPQDSAHQNLEDNLEDLADG